MPSPIAHTAMGYLIHRLMPEKGAEARRQALPWRKQLRQSFSSPYFWAFAALSMLPDVDAAVGFLSGNIGRFHNNGTHSLVIGLLVALAVAGVVWLRRRSGFRYWLLGAFACYALHVMMDAFSLETRGVMLFWPLSEQRFSAPVKLFLGVQWGRGLWSIVHLWTIGSELLFTGLILSVVYIIENYSHVQREAASD